MAGRVPQQSGFERYKVVDFYKHKLLFELANTETKKISNNLELLKTKLNAYRNLMHLMQIEFSNEFVEFG